MKKKKFNFKKTANRLLRNKPKKKYHKMFLYVIIVNFGLGEVVVDLLEENNSNMQFALVGKGTADKEILRVIGLQDERKDIIFAFVDEKEIKNISSDLNELFLQKRRFMGMGFTIPMTSVVGEKIYHFLSNTI